MIKKQLLRTIKEYSLLEKGDFVLIGLSGGADSVCLTHALFAISKDFDLKLCCAHINHGIRGNEAKRDEEFAVNFSKSLGIECYVLNADAPGVARERNISEELAGREIRYDFFRELQKTYGINKIATAHNKNDNAETITMNFLRGSAISGLCGIPHKRDTIIRPLLDISRNEIEEYCRKNNLEYMTDCTNKEQIYTRNKIRNSLFPYIMNEFNPSFSDTVTENSKIISAENEFLTFEAQKAYNKCCVGGKISLDCFNKLHTAIKRRVIRQYICIIENGVTDVPSVYINDILSLCKKNSGASVNLHSGLTARIEYGNLVIGREEKQCEPFEYTLSAGESAYIAETGQTVSISHTDMRQKDDAIYLAYSQGDIIKIRNRRSGDKFSPYGMSGTKKVKEYMIDNKIPRYDRARMPIIEINGEIAAVGGRVSNAFVFRDKGIRIEFNRYRRHDFEE